ncbi:uncharacterized protein LOC144820058 [Lissotriton helveticus]
MEHALLYSFLVILLAGPAVLLPTQTRSHSEVTSKRVVRAILEGLRSLQIFAESLQSCGGRQPDFQRDLLPGLSASLKSMSRAQEVCQSHLSSKRSCEEKRLNGIKALEDELRLLDARLRGLKQQLSGLQALERSSRKGAEAARRALVAAHGTLAQLTQQAENARKAFDAQIASLLHLNLFKVSFLISDNGAVSSAQNQVNEAQRSLNAQLNTMNMYVTQSQSCRQSIEETLRAIDAIKKKIQALPRFTKQDTLVQQQFTNFLIPVSQCTALFRTMVGHVNGTQQEDLLKSVSQLLDSLVPVLDGLVKVVRPLVRNDSTYQLLIALRLYTVIDKLEQANQKIKETLAA